MKKRSTAFSLAEKNPISCALKRLDIGFHFLHSGIQIHLPISENQISEAGSDRFWFLACCVF